MTPAAGYVLDGSNASESFTPHINDWDNNVEINNNGNGFQTYAIQNPHDSEIKIGWEVISFDHPIEWEVQNLLSITGPSGHKPIPFAFETTGAFWAWANGTYTFDDFFNP